MTAYALELLKKHDERVAAEKNRLLAEKIKKMSHDLKNADTKPSAVQKVLLEAATPDIIAFNNSELSLGDEK